MESNSYPPLDTHYRKFFVFDVIINTRELTAVLDLKSSVEQGSHSSSHLEGFLALLLTHEIVGGCAEFMM